MTILEAENQTLRQRLREIETALRDFGEVSHGFPPTGDPPRAALPSVSLREAGSPGLPASVDH